MTLRTLVGLIMNRRQDDTPEYGRFTSQTCASITAPADTGAGPGALAQGTRCDGVAVKVIAGTCECGQHTLEAAQCADHDDAGQARTCFRCYRDGHICPVTTMSVLNLR